MRIAVMVNSLMDIGGIAKHAISLSREFSEMGHEVTVWAVEYDKEHCYPDLAKDLDIRSLRCTRRVYSNAGRIPGSGMIAGLHSFQVTYQDQHRLSQVMNTGYDIINPHGNLIIWSAAEYKRKHEVPVVWMCNDFWPPMGNIKPNKNSSSLRKIKYIFKQCLSLPVTTYDRPAVRSIDRIAVLSEIVKRQMAEYYCVSPVVVRKGVNIDLFADGCGEKVRSRYAIPERSFLLLTVCVLMPRRRLEDAIQAVEILVSQGYDVTYLIAGKTTHSPEYTRFILNEVASRHLENHVFLVGDVSEEDLVSCYRASDAFIWPADETQSWGSAGMEALSAGKPVIVSRANGLAEILENRHTGFLVPPREPGAIVDVLKDLISYPALAESIGKAGQQLMREKYSWCHYAQHMLELFQEVITGPKHFV